MITTTIPKKALVALPDLSVVPPEQATVSAFDRSFHFGDSLYEAIRSYNGILFSLEEHMGRLRRSADMALFEVMPDTDRIIAQIHKGCRAFFQAYGNLEVFVRITVSRGVGDINIDRATAGDPYSLVFIREFKPYSEQVRAAGLHYWLVDRRRNLPTALDAAMKTGNYLNNVLALAEAKRAGADDAVMLDYRGYVTEGTTNNLYAVKNGEVWTAPLGIGILAGVTREWIFEVCRRTGVPIQEKLFTADELRSADEVFTSATTKEVMPITRLSGQPVGTGRPGPVTQKLLTAFRALVAEYCDRHRAESLYL